jgi:hypothetical protein
MIFRSRSHSLTGSRSQRELEAINGVYQDTLRRLSGLLGDACVMGCVSVRNRLGPPAGEQRAGPRGSDLLGGDAHGRRAVKRRAVGVEGWAEHRLIARAAGPCGVTAALLEAAYSAMSRNAVDGAGTITLVAGIGSAAALFVLLNLGRGRVHARMDDGSRLRRDRRGLDRFHRCGGRRDRSQFP